MGDQMGGVDRLGLRRAMQGPIALPADQLQALVALRAGGLRLTVMIQDGEVRLLQADGSETVLQPVTRMGAQAA